MIVVEPNSYIIIIKTYDSIPSKTDAKTEK